MVGTFLAGWEKLDGGRNVNTSTNSRRFEETVPTAILQGSVPQMGPYPRGQGSILLICAP